MSSSRLHIRVFAPSNHSTTKIPFAHDDETSTRYFSQQHQRQPRSPQSAKSSQNLAKHQTTRESPFVISSDENLDVDIIQFCTWGERWGSSDYATRTASGPDVSNGETQHIYDFQIEFSSASTNEEHATASEPEVHRRHSPRSQNRRSERCSGAKRVEPYRGIPLPKVQSGTTAVDNDVGLAWFTPGSSPEEYPTATSRGKMPRAWKPSSAPSGRHATPDSVVIPVSNSAWPGASSHSLGSIPTSFPLDGIASPDDRFASSPEEDAYPYWFQQHNFYPPSPHDVAIAQTGHQVSVETSYATPSGSPPIPGYGYNMPDSMIQWALTYPVVTTTCQTVPTALPPYTVAPGVNRPF